MSIFPMRIGQKCFCAVCDKHLFHISFNEARLIGATNSSVSENNPETIDSVPKFMKNRPFPRISRNFRKESKEAKQKRKKSETKKKIKKRLWPNIALGRLVAKSLVVFGVLLFVCFGCFFGCLGQNPLYCAESLR